MQTKLVHKHKVTPPGVLAFIEDTSLASFMEGEVAMLRNWPYVWMVGNAPDSPIAGKFTVTTNPKSPLNISAHCAGVMYWVIPAFSDNPKEAWDLLEHLASYEAQKRIWLEVGYAAGRTALWQDPEVLEKFPASPLILDAMLTAVHRPMVAEYPKISTVLQKAFHAALTLEMTVQEALDWAANEIETILE
jgi:ABC-type glycerol-3-phosphate transport system substrate-binding protein